jgi:hypothetical protein
MVKHGLAIIQHYITPNFMFNHRFLGNVWVSIRDPVAVSFEDSWCCARGPLGCQQGVPVDFMAFSLLYIQQKYIRCQYLAAWSSHWQTHFWSGLFFQRQFLYLKRLRSSSSQRSSNTAGPGPQYMNCCFNVFPIFFGPMPFTVRTTSKPSTI